MSETTDTEITALTRDLIAPELRESGRAVIVDVWGPQCKPCIALAPTFEELASKHDERAKFFKLEAPKNRMACVDLKVVSLPTFLFYDNGREIDRLSGEVSAAELGTWVEAKITGKE
jgi:thioredoxin 1